MRTTRTANRDMSEPISRLDEFEGSNVFAEFNDRRYVVYSYGYHFPMYIHIEGKWIGNSDKYSVTTSKHMSQAYPGRVDKYISNPQMMDLAKGYITLQDIGL